MQVKLIVGVNDLASSNPALVAEWHLTKNQPLHPTDVYEMSSQMVWWQCSKGHEWRQRVNTRHKSKCPYCLNQKVWSGFNDLATTHPELVNEWDFNANTFDPTEVIAGTSKFLHWICEKGHKWEATGNRRVGGSKCPYCANRQTLEGFNDLAFQYPEIARDWDHNKNGETKPNTVVSGSNMKAAWLCVSGHSWAAKVVERTRDGRQCPHCRERTEAQKRSAKLEKLRGKLEPFFDSMKNKVRLSDVAAHSLESVYWWKCGEGHSWQRPIALQAKTSGCPFCSGNRIQRGVTDLASKFPTLVREWDFDANNGMSPSNFHVSSGKRVSWKCTLGHCWVARIAERTSGGNCPYCQGKKVLPGFNDLKTHNPQLARYWADDLNQPSSSEVLPSSNKKFWWRCQEGHEIHKSPNGFSQSGCGYCANKKVLDGWNDLQTRYPRLAAQFDVIENRGVAPSEVVAAGLKKFVWKCELGHRWEATVASRIRGNGCPICANKVVLKGFNDLGTTNPTLVDEWDFERNAPFIPSEVLGRGSGKVFWWTCVEGHSWKTAVLHRDRGNGCPRCAKYGFDTASEGIIYFIANDALRARKIGITGVSTRESRLEAFYASGWRPVQTFGPMHGRKAKDIESTIIQRIRGHYGLPAFLGSEDMQRTGGATETFEAAVVEDDLLVSEITSLIESYRSR